MFYLTMISNCMIYKVSSGGMVMNWEGHGKNRSQNTLGNHVSMFLRGMKRKTLRFLVRIAALRV